MNITEQLEQEWAYLSTHHFKAIMVSNTAKENGPFNILPRRYAQETMIACFLINDPSLLEETISFFDGKVDTIYIDVEQKQAINLLEIAKPLIKQSTFVSVKPNDLAVEACDHLLRYTFDDDIAGKNVLVIGTGNLASKITLRMVERQANVYVHGRSKEKEAVLVQSSNQFAPKYTKPVQSFEDWKKQWSEESIDIVISFITGTYWAEEELLAAIHEQTLIVDGGINNFSSTLIKQLLAMDVTLIRVDVRFALAYQFLAEMEETRDFYQRIFGKRYEGDICLVSGGFLGEEGSIIVDQIEEPTQVVGIADGRGGVKKEDKLTPKDREAIKTTKHLMQNK